MNADVVLRLLNILEQLSEEKGVPKQESLVNKNVIKSQNSTFDSDKKKNGLSRNDKQVLVDTFNLFNRMFFDYQKTFKPSNPLIPPPIKKEYSHVENSSISNQTNTNNNSQYSTSINNVYEYKEDSSSNKRRLWIEKFNLFNQMFFDYKKRLDPDTSERTKVSVLTKGQLPNKVEKKTEDSSFLGTVSKITAGLALISASVVGILGSVAGFFGKFDGVVKTLSKVGLIGSLKILSKTILKRFSLAVLKRLPIIGGIIGLAYAVKAFKNGDIFLGISELISGLLNFIPGVGPLLSLGADLLIGLAQSKGVFSKGGSLSPENGWNSIKEWASIIGKKITDNAIYIPIIGTFKRFGMAYDQFKSGNIGEGIKQLGLGFLTTIPGGGGLIKGMEVLAGWVDSSKQPDGTFQKDNSWMGKIKKWIVSKLDELPEFLKIPLRWFGVLDDNGPTNFSSIGSSIKDSAKKGVTNITNFVSDIWSNIDTPMRHTVDNIRGFVGSAWDKTREHTAKAWSVISEESPKIWNSIKDNSVKAWNYSVEESSKLWSSIVDITKKSWDKTKEFGSIIGSMLLDMSKKATIVIGSWIPGIVDTISGVAESAMTTLRNIASKIGSWIADLFNFQTNVSNNIVQEQHPQEIVVSRNTEAENLLVRNNITSNKWLNQLHEASIEQVRLLGMLVNVNNDSLRELRRISGNSSQNTSTYVVPSQPTQKTPLINVQYNRNGYTDSPYALTN